MLNYQRHSKHSRAKIFLLSFAVLFSFFFLKIQIFLLIRWVFSVIPSTHVLKVFFSLFAVFKKIPKKISPYVTEPKMCLSYLLFFRRKPKLDISVWVVKRFFFLSKSDEKSTKSDSVAVLKKILFSRSTELAPRVLTRQLPGFCQSIN